jgi:hypothetical protein
VLTLRKTKRDDYSNGYSVAPVLLANCWQKPPLDARLLLRITSSPLGADRFPRFGFLRRQTNVATIFRYSLDTAPNPLTMIFVAI